MRLRSLVAPLVLLTLSVVLAGCVGPTAGGQCFLPQKGDVDYILDNHEGGTRGVPASGPDQWAMRVSCAEEFRPVEELTFTFETPEHGRLVATLDTPLPNDGRLTLYAVVAGADESSTTDFTDTFPPAGTGEVYRLRIQDDERSRQGLDDRDWLTLTFDEADRSFDSALPVGTYALTISERTTGEELGTVSRQFFDEEFPTGEDETADEQPGGTE